MLVLPELWQKVYNRGLRGDYQAGPVPWVPCPGCGSQIGEPCRGHYGRHLLTTHVDRRAEFKRLKLGIKRTFQILGELGA